MDTTTTDLVIDHQQTLLAEASRARRGDRLAKVQRLHRRAEQAARREERAASHLS
jgi:hypothetical protein